MPQKFKTVAEIPMEYHLCQIEGEFFDLEKMVGVMSPYGYGFALLNETDILELWGFNGGVPYMNKFVYQVYPVIEED